MSLRMAVGACAVLACASISGAAAWTVPAGVQPTFSYDSGQNINGIFGDGTGQVNGFTLVPTNFAAVSSNGTPTVKTDTTSVNATAAAGLVFQTVLVELRGDYSILGSGQVDAVGTLQVTNLDAVGVGLVPLLFTGVPASTLVSTEGDFIGTGFFALPAGWSHIGIQFSGTLSSVGNANSTSTIEAKNAKIILTTAAIPEPTSLALLAGGSLLMLRRRSGG